MILRSTLQCGRQEGGRSSCGAVTDLYFALVRLLGAAPSLALAVANVSSGDKKRLMLCESRHQPHAVPSMHLLLPLPKACMCKSLSVGAWHEAGIFLERSTKRTWVLDPIPLTPQSPMYRFKRQARAIMRLFQYVRPYTRPAVHDWNGLGG